jgi:tellurium resistance protein TerZ
MLSQSYGHVDTCYFSNKDVAGVHHRGDNLTGEGKGDDEVIDVHLSQVSPEVHHLVFVVNIYSDGRSFREVFDSYCRLCSGGNEVARFKLDAHIGSRAFIFASISRSGGGWAMRALGVPCNGKRAPESVDQVQQVMKGNALTDVEMVGGCCTIS